MLSVCVNLFSLSRPTASRLLSLSSYTHSVFDCLFAVLCLFPSLLDVLLFFKTLTLSWSLSLSLLFFLLDQFAATKNI